MSLLHQSNIASALDRAGSAQSLPSAAIRLEASRLVGHNRIDDAKHLVDQGFIKYGLTEDLLAMKALIAQLQMDWTVANSAYEALSLIQSPNVKSSVWLSWVRVLICMGDKPKAISTLRKALSELPDDASLAKEAQVLGVEASALSRRAA